MTIYYNFALRANIKGGLMIEIQLDNYIQFRANVEEEDEIERRVAEHVKRVKRVSTSDLLAERRFYHWPVDGVDGEVERQLDLIIRAELNLRGHVLRSDERKLVRQNRGKRKRNKGKNYVRKNICHNRGNSCR